MNIDRYVNNSMLLGGQMIEFVNVWLNDKKKKTGNA